MNGNPELHSADRHSVVGFDNEDYAEFNPIEMNVHQQSNHSHNSASDRVIGPVVTENYFDKQNIQNSSEYPYDRNSHFNPNMLGSELLEGYTTKSSVMCFSQFEMFMIIVSIVIISYFLFKYMSSSNGKVFYPYQS